MDNRRRTDGNLKVKRRKRESPFLDGLPKVPGVPGEIVAVQSQCLRHMVSFLRLHAPNKPLVLYKRLAEQSSSAASTFVTAQNQANNGEQQPNENEQRMNQAFRHWIRTVHTCVVQDKRSSGALIVSLLQFLVGRSQKDSFTRRASNHMGGLLLWKSADARRWWLQDDDRLLEWTNDVAKTTDDTYKVEAWYLLRDAAESFSKYPTVAIAAQRLEQLCPHVIVAANSAHPEAISVTELRSIRDEAIDQSENLEAIVRKRIERAHDCLDIIAPSVQHESHGREISIYDGNKKEEEGDDDDSIDWEDGDDGNDHEAEVERTLETMAAAGGLHEGGLEIDFSTPLENSSAQQDRAKDRLAKLVDRLSTKYLSLLSRWVNGLLQADDLMVQADGTTLVRCSQQRTSLRRVALNRCLTMKRQISSLITSAQRLGIEEEKPKKPSPPSPQVANSLTSRSTEKHSHLQKAMMKRRRGDGRLRSRIQIKYNKGI